MAQKRSNSTVDAESAVAAFIQPQRPFTYDKEPVQSPRKIF